MRLVMLNTGTVENLFSVVQYSEVKHDHSIGATTARTPEPCVMALATKPRS